MLCLRRGHLQMSSASVFPSLIWGLQRRRELPGFLCTSMLVLPAYSPPQGNQERLLIASAGLPALRRPLPWGACCVPSIIPESGSTQPSLASAPLCLQLHHSWPSTLTTLGGKDFLWGHSSTLHTRLPATHTCHSTAGTAGLPPAQLTRSKHTWAHTRACAHMGSPRHVHTQAQAHTPAHTQACDTQAHIHSGMLTHGHTHTYRHSHTHAHMLTHSSFRSLPTLSPLEGQPLPAPMPPGTPQNRLSYKCSVLLTTTSPKPSTAPGTLRATRSAH